MFLVVQVIILFLKFSNKKYNLKIKYCLFLFFLFFSCKVDDDVSNKISIIQPKSSCVYYDDTKILFYSNLNSEDIKWYSDIDGYLGKGNGVLAYLSPGKHNIKFKIYDIEKITSIYVKQKENKEIEKLLLTNKENEVLIPNENVSLCLLNLSSEKNCNYVGFSKNYTQKEFNDNKFVELKKNMFDYTNKENCKPINFIRSRNIFNSYNYGIDYEKKFLPDGFCSIVYDVPAKCFENGCALLEISEPLNGVIIYELKFEKTN